MSNEPSGCDDCCCSNNSIEQEKLIHRDAAAADKLEQAVPSSTTTTTDPSNSDNGNGDSDEAPKDDAIVPWLKEMWIKVADATKGLFQHERLRSASYFVGIGEEDRAYVLETTYARLVERFQHNIVFFQWNYLRVAGVVFFLTLIVSPAALLVLGLLALLWMAVIRASRSGNLELFGASIPRKQATLATGGVSAFILYWMLSSIFWWNLFVCGVIIAVHASTRNASMRKDVEDKDADLANDDDDDLKKMVKGGVAAKEQEGDNGAPLTTPLAVATTE